MKTLLNMKIVLLMAAVFALPVMAQWNAIAPLQTANASAPVMAFQSTSTLHTSGSAYSTNPMLNDDGTATYEGEDAFSATSLSGPRRVAPVTPDDDPTPLGDGMWALLIMTSAYVFGKWRLRKREVTA